MISDEESPLRKAEREIYTVDGIAPKRRSLLREKKVDVSEDWNQPSDHPTQELMTHNKNKTTSFFKNLFGVSLVMLCIAVFILGLSFITGNNNISSKKVAIDIATKSFVDGGEDLLVNVSVVNRNKLPLELATVILEYPEGGEQDSGASARIIRDIGTIGVGDTHQESFTIQLYGQEGSEKDITTTVQFRVPGSNAVYDTQESVRVVVRSSPVLFTLQAPEQVVPNQEVLLVFNFSSNASSILSNSAIILQYPPGFTMTRSVPDATTDNRIWYIGDIAPGTNRTITVYGTFAGSVNDAKTIRASLGAQNPKNEKLLDTTYNSVVQVITLTSAFLDARIKVSGSDASATDMIAVPANNNVSIDIPWENVTGTQITNAEIRVRLSGSAYDPANVQVPSGFFDTLNNQIIWTKQQQPGLATINPGTKGSVGFSINPKTIGLGSVSNPQIIISVDISGFQAGGSKLSTEGVDTKKIVINSDLNLLVKTVHYGGQLQNSGPMPPKVNTETTYTLDWQVTNMRNKVSNVKVSTILPLYINYKNAVLPQNEAQNVSYNTVTRELIWNVGDVPAGVGGTSPARSVGIKVGITPTLAQIGSPVPLSNAITISGKDTFTGSTITVTRQATTTQVFNDISTVGADGKIVP